MRNQVGDSSGSNSARFDRSTWITLTAAISLMALCGIVIFNLYKMPSDGWLMDRGPAGRYEIPNFEVYFGKIYTEIEVGDQLLAVEGQAFEYLEAQAAIVAPQRPPNWQVGQTVRYTLLREGQMIDVDVVLIRSPILAPYRPSVIFRFPVFLGSPILFLSGLLVFVLRPKLGPAQLFFMFGLALLMSDLVGVSFILPSVGDLFSVATYWPRIMLGDFLWVFLIIPLLLHIFLTFPVKKWPMRRFPRLAPILIYGIYSGGGFIIVLQHILGFDLEDSLFLALLIPFIILITFSLAHTYFSVREEVARMQIRWISLGAIIGGIGPPVFWDAVGGLSLASPIWQHLFYLLLFIALPVSLTIAILRYRLWDFDLVIKKALVYGSLTAVLAAIYFGSVVSLEKVFRLFLNQEASSLVIVVSTLAIAALFNPLRRRLQTSIDRRFYRNRYDAEQTLLGFSATLREDVDLESLSNLLLAVVADTMQPSQLSLELRAPSRGQSTKRE